MEWIFHKPLSNNSIYILVSGSARSIDPCTLLNRLLTLLIDAARETAEQKRSKGAPPDKRQMSAGGRSRLQKRRQQKECNKDMQMRNFIATGSLSKLTVPLAVPRIKDHF